MRVAIKMQGVCLSTICFMCISILTACAETEEAQIRQVVEQYVETLPGECFIYGSWPRTGMRGNLISAERAAFLSKIGLAEFERPTSIFQVGRLTDEGQKYFSPDAESPNMFGGKGALCVGNRAFLQIDEYTTPSEMMGMTVTTVRYRYHLIDVPDWISTPEALRIFPQSASRLEATDIISNVQLIKTNKGWRVAK